MSLPIIFDSMNKMLEELQIAEIFQVDKEIGEAGIGLTLEAAKEIIQVRNQVLQSYGRIELDIAVTKKIINNFCTSSYINQEDYTSIIIELQEIFYYMKNETEDKIGDDELIEVITEFFNNSCGGSLELLKGRELDAFARNFRRDNAITKYFLEGEDREWD
jgi:hypothetical protein